MSETRRAHLLKLGSLGAMWLLGCDRSSPNSSDYAPVTNVTRGPFFVDTIDDPNVGDSMGPPPGMHRGPPPGMRRGPPPGMEGPPPGGKLIDRKIPARADVRADIGGTAGVQPGVPLAFALTIHDLANGSPLVGARVDVWHCNAAGVYSDVHVGMNDHGADHSGENFLRGYQLTDDRGAVAFTTVYPGWYMGRTVHVHFKVRVIDPSGAITTEVTSQLFFSDATSDAVFAGHPAYAQAADRMRNADDDIFAQESPALVLEPVGSIATGFHASLALGVTTGTRFGG